MRRQELSDFGDFGGFGRVSVLERRRADAFFDDLVGARPRERSTAEALEDAPPTAPVSAPTITLSTNEVLVCVGGINNAAITATTNGGGTVSWSIDDPTRASISGSGNTATIRGRHPGVTKVKATLTSGGTTVTATAKLLVIFVQLLLRNGTTDTIEPAPENEDEAAERAAAGTNALGPLAMGTGRADAPFANASYISATLVIGRVFPAAAATRFTFRWQRLITRRSWRIRRNAAGTRWSVTFRNQRGPLDDDTGAPDFNDATPSTPARRMYMYDNSGDFLGPETLAVGEYIHHKKDFVYRIWIRLNGVWSICSAIHLGQVITARRIATSGTVATDWTGIENSTAIRRVNMTITEPTVRAIVGGSDPIDIAAGANP
jgi:hypothetical protein